MLQVFYLDVSKVYGVVDSVFQMHISFVLSAFRHMLQTLYSDVSKVDEMLHPCLCFFYFLTFTLCHFLLLSAPIGHLLPLLLFQDAGLAIFL